MCLATNPLIPRAEELLAHRRVAEAAAGLAWLCCACSEGAALCPAARVVVELTGSLQDVLRC